MANPLSNLFQQNAPAPLRNLQSSAPIDLIRVNRERAAVLAKQGFAAYDTWKAMRPALAIGGAIGIVGSAVMLFKRRKTPEAVALYTLTLALSAGALYVSRPLDLMGFTTPEPTPPNDPAASNSFVQWLDQKRSDYAADDPRWVDRTMSRVRSLPAVQSAIQQQPLIAAVL